MVLTAAWLAASPVTALAQPAADFLPPLVQPATTNDVSSTHVVNLNFRNVPLESVLNYLSDAAGFIILVETSVDDPVTIVSEQPVTPDEAVDLLNAELSRDHCIAIREGRTLTIAAKTEALALNQPVKTGNNSGAIPKDNDVATWIIPVRFVEAGTLLKELAPFVSSQATIVANEAGNAIVVTDTQSNIRHLAKLIEAVDSCAETGREIRVFHLKFANPAEVADELSSVFPGNSSSDNRQPTPVNLEDGGSNGTGSQNDRIKTATQVMVAVDSRIQAVIVTAPKDLMAQIAGLMNSLDVASDRDQQVFVYHLNNGDPNQVVSVLQGLFQSSSTDSTGTSAAQNSPLQQRAANSTTAASASTTGGGNGSGNGSTSGGKSGAP